MSHYTIISLPKKMKYLLCTHIFEDEIVLKNIYIKKKHYIQIDRVNSDDSFFKALFQKSKKKHFSLENAIDAIKF